MIISKYLNWSWCHLVCQVRCVRSHLFHIMHPSIPFTGAHIMACFCHAMCTSDLHTLVLVFLWNIVKNMLLFFITLMRLVLLDC